MKDNKYLLSVLFTLTLACVLLVCVIVKLFFPLVILPQWNIPNLVLLSLIPLVLHSYLGKPGKENYLALFLLSAVSCALLPWVTGWIAPAGMLSCALSGGAVFTATAWLYASLTDRLSSGPQAKAAPILGALGLYLAAQAFQGILL